MNDENLDLAEADAREATAQRAKANQATASSRRQNDPFLIYGAGVQNYFVLQERLLWLFFFLTIGACC